MGDYTAVALCAAGAEKAVSNELKKLPESGAPFTIIDSGFGKVRFTANAAGLYRALLCLRVADRVLLEAASYDAPDFEALFEGARAVRWEEYLPRGMGIRVGKVRTNRSALRAETSVQASVHKAAAGRLCERFGIRRLPGPEEAKQAELRVYLEKDRASLLLDLSGEPLFKRGYRRDGGPAPLRETAAAAVILLSGWKRKFPLYDPLCGSGTIAIEAAMYAWNMAPGIGRDFALDDLAIGDRRTGAALRRDCTAAVEFGRKIRIYGSDADESMITLAKANAARALRLAGPSTREAPRNAAPEFITLDMARARPPDACGGESGCIITNPPYGRRLGDAASSENGYRNMAVLAEHFPGWKCSVICDHPGFESHFGAKAASCRELKNGAVNAYLYQYEHLSAAERSAAWQ